MSEFWCWLQAKMSTRRCCGCSDESFHTAHLTAYGRWHYTRRIR